ncbi:NUDIX hydrolase [Cellulomonas pakistanensis]|uniref:ADP-ribose pyrophosphatase n=1 Tax=Cellulomonas pakistanensis TaxID=992287 RepID=A0A919PCL0_9CELL|nr:NUDIX hydrolase [Cellulomonas pakistanensis]GIG37263.1 ADP-ribose pyrophosphatase [Cellulomonas pakistanensis]
MSAGPSALVRAAGALVWRVRQGRLQVVLVHRPRYKDWSWPKGKLEPGEHPATAAVREVEEETGLDVVLGRPLPGLEYDLADGRRKRVHYWAAQVAGRPDRPAVHARPPAQHASKDEIDAVRWADADVARKRLTRADDRTPLDALVEAYEKGRLDTRAVLVVRHGRAKSRSSWGREEGTRPLTEVGRRQAAALVPVLSAYGVAEVVTSPWLRCGATVEPYASAAGLPLDRREPLTEAQHEESPEKTADVVAGVLRAGADVALCTHRPVLPTVLAAVGAHARAAVRDRLPAENPYLRPGQVLVCHVARTGAVPDEVRVEDVEVHTPLGS